MELDFEKYKELQFCKNKKCGFYGQVGADNIKIKSSKHHQVYCNSCKKSWVITKNTFFYHLKTPPKEVLEVLLLLSEGMGIRAVSRVKKFTTDIVLEWVLKAGEHVEEISNLLTAQMNLTQCQIDEFWSFIKKKKVSLLKKRREIKT